MNFVVNSNRIYRMFGDYGNRSVPAYVSESVDRAFRSWACFSEVQSSDWGTTCVNRGISHPYRSPIDKSEPFTLTEPGNLDLFLTGKEPPTPILWTAMGPLLRQDLACALMQKKLTGVSFLPATIYRNRTRKDTLDGYVEMRVKGKVSVDEKKSGVWLKYECDVCGARLYSEWDDKCGLHFSGDSEDWPDFFNTNQGLGGIFVKGYVAEFMISLGSDLLVLTEVEDLRPFGYRPFHPN